MATDVANPGQKSLPRAREEALVEQAANKRKARARLAALRRWSPTERRRRLEAALEVIQRALDGTKETTAFHRSSLLHLKAFLLPPQSDEK